MADDMLQTGHGESDYIKDRQKEINARWQRLNRLKLDKEKTLEGASRLE